MKTISIITNKNVDKTFEGEDCLLKRTVISTYKENKTKKYVILTERCKYKTKLTQIFNQESGNPELDKEGNEIFKDVTTLVSFGKKDKEAVFKLSFDEINDFYNNIKNLIPEELNKTEKENLEEQIILLQITKQDKPWGTSAEDWELLN